MIQILVPRDCRVRGVPSENVSCAQIGSVNYLLFVSVPYNTILYVEELSGMPAFVFCYGGDTDTLCTK